MASPKNTGSSWSGIILGVGGDCFVSIYTEATVLKGYEVWKDGRMLAQKQRVESAKEGLERELEVYNHLGTHSSILRCLGLVEIHQNVFSLHLELASKGDLRSYMKQHDPCSTSRGTRLQWAIDLAHGLSHIHSKNVFHCDMSCRNILLTTENRVKIADFGGSSILGKEPLSCEEPWYELPSRGRTFEERPFMKRELFALGCAIYEIMAWKKPFGDLSPEGVLKCYERGELPSLYQVTCDEVISKCWQEIYVSAYDVAVELESMRDEHPVARDCAPGTDFCGEWTLARSQ